MEERSEKPDLEMNELPLLTSDRDRDDATTKTLLTLISSSIRSPESEPTSDAKDDEPDLEKGLLGNGAASDEAFLGQVPSVGAADPELQQFQTHNSKDIEMTELPLLTITTSTRSPEAEAPSDAKDDEQDLEEGNGDPEFQRRRVKEIVREKKVESLIRFGRVEGVARALNSNLNTGISGNSDDNILERKMVEVSETHNNNYLIKKSCKSWSIMLLILGGVLSLAFGMIEEGAQSGWLDGAIVFVTLFVLVLFSSIRNWSDARTARKKKKKDVVKVCVVRGGKEVEISVSDLVSGDLACVKARCVVPGDGLFVCGEGLEIDDGSECRICNDQNPFLSYGSRVVKGSATMLVTSKGMDDTVLGEKMREALLLNSSSSTHHKNTNIETSLDKLNEWIHIGGLLISILICVVLFLRFRLGKIDDHSGNRPDSKGAPTEVERIMNALKIISTESKGNARVLTTLLGVSLVGIMEGIPFVVAIAIAYWNSNTLSDRALPKDILTCVKMAKVTTICTHNVGWLKEHRFEVGEVFLSSNSDVCKAALRDGILTSTLNPQTAHSKIMDQSLLSWAEESIDLQTHTSNKCIIIANEEACDEEACGVVVETTTDSGKEFDVHFKGHAEPILNMCSSYYDPNGKIEAIDEKKKQEFTQKMKDMQGKHLEVIAYASKSTPVQKLEAEGLTFLGMFGLRDPITSLVKGRINIIFFSQHDVAELNTISTDALVFNTSEDLQDKKMSERSERVKVVGKCNSTVKRHIMSCLKCEGEVVAVLGERSADAPIMKAADIGLAIKTDYSSEITTQSADLIILKGKFGLLNDMIICGRIINENLQKFFQIEVIMVIASSLINFISAVSSGDNPLSAIQLFWIYFLTSFPGALALLSAQPNKNLKDTIRPTGPLITNAMCLNILLQSSYQVSIFVTLQLKGTAIFGISQEVNESMIFNGFVLCQLFNIFSSRELKEMNIFKGINQNSWFWVGSCAFVVIHVPFVAFDQIIVVGAGLNWKQWFLCCLFGAGTWVMDLLGKLLSHLIKIDEFQISEIARHCFTTPELDWFNRMRRSTSMSLNTSSPSESMSNLQNPLMTDGSTPNTFQSNT